MPDVMVSKKELSLADLRLLCQLVEQHLDEAVAGDCHTCKGEDENCPKCEAVSDLGTKLNDMESLVAVGCVGLAIVQPDKQEAA
jgi:hypothetical protein